MKPYVFHIWFFEFCVLLVETENHKGDSENGFLNCPLCHFCPFSATHVFHHTTQAVVDS
jgi:hypothetical protein